MAITEAFDNTTEEVLKPSNMARQVDGFPELVIVTFNAKILDVMLKNNESEVISNMVAGFDHPIYKTIYNGKEIAFYMTSTGAPATVALLEEIIVKGGKKILLFGSCGSLDNSITDGHIVVPTHAYRDEGTSYHYAAPSEDSFIEVSTAMRTYELLKELKIPAICGKTWTTDGIYRETRRNVELRKKAGCITVEMECASVVALAQFRNVDVYQFLYTADNLDCAQWEARMLDNLPDDFKEKYTRIAFEIAVRL